jgi:uncharacterized membrane protein SirB2
MTAPETWTMNYLFLKYLHIVCVAASFALFFVRGLWIMKAYPSAQEPWIRALPHVIDSLLLLSAVGMLVTAQRIEWAPWMQVKLGLVVMYFGLAVVVFRAGTQRLHKTLAWLGGLLLFLYVTTIAVLQHPVGIFSLF